jgi:hypothetical protein
MTKHDESPPAIPLSSEPARPAPDDDVIRLEDLTPAEDVRGGRKILLGEVPTPTSNPRFHPAT